MKNRLKKHMVMVNRQLEKRAHELNAMINRDDKATREFRRQVQAGMKKSRKKADAAVRRVHVGIAKSRRKADRAVLDAKKSKRNRDRAIDRAEWGAGSDWLVEAYKAARKVAETFRFFTTDDVWKAGLVKPYEPRALGPVMLSLERDGIITATARFKSTAQPSRNCAPVRLWRSNVYAG
jgi:hypothetical protein